MDTFKDLGVHPSFVKGLNEMNILTPTPIQQKAIPILIEENIDLVGQAQTGTGKTAAFGLPMLQRIDARKKQVQGLILCPTRELGQQIAKQLFKFTKYSAKIFCEAVYGGEKIDIQINRLARPTHIIVATPGRLIDLVNRNAVDLSHVETIVLDEADEMLSMGFKKELNQILRFVESAKSKWLFSATLPQGIKHIISDHLSEDAVKIEISGKEVVNKKISHQFVVCDEVNKLHTLLQFLNETEEDRGVVFCRTKAAAQKLAKQLAAKNIAADSIHGDLLQKERDKAMRAFKNKNLRVLVATDIAARGIDVANLAFVVHYQLPDKNEYFTHRSGRTARAGKRGVSLSIVTTAEKRQLKFYEKSLGIAFTQINF